MRKRLQKWALLPVFLALVACSTAPGSEFSWLAGRWVMLDGDTRMEENWIVEENGDMRAEGLTFRAGERISAETLVIRMRPSPVYLASPGRREPVPFYLADRGTGFAAFENPDHDYPQRITYRRDGDRLVARVSLINGESAQEWTLTLSDKTL